VSRGRALSTRCCPSSLQEAVAQTAPERRRSKVKLSGAMPAAKDASASRNVAPHCIRWNAVLDGPRHGPRHDQVRLMVRP
jgi:hypothetical protein